ncbi:MAG: hypothetical protein H6722_04685 [Sandaracinus sp.]|nr:hypothetical protein [Sandaracinus sp.]MCB9622400.1 hypothetical protein [Sandaracinus sp.]
MRLFALVVVLAPTSVLAQPPPPRAPTGCTTVSDTETECHAPAHPEAGPVQVALGSDFGCGLAANGTVRCWGRSDDGQCGVVAGSVPTPSEVAGLDHVAAIGVGYGHACALREGGEVWCWGDGGHGQLGVEVESRATPAKVEGLTDVRQIAVGGFHNCALRGDGAVLCWGSNDAGNLGDGREREHRATPMPVRGVRATEIWSGQSFTCARERRGVKCWGLSEHGQAGTRRRVRTARPTRLAGVGPRDAVVLAGSFGCALANGRLRCWGNNLFNVDGAVSMHPRAVDVPTWRGVAQLSARTEDLCGVREGRVSCQGVNRRDHLRVPTTEAGQVVSDPSEMPGVTDAVEVVTGWFTQCLRHETGAWSCWGWNRGARVGAVGVGSREDRVVTPTRLPW